MTQIVSKQQALEIARSQLSPTALAVLDEQGFWGSLKVTDKPEGRITVYQTWADEPIWYVYVPWGDGHDGNWIRSSRVILISKKDGRVVYDGSANDEG